MDKHLKTNIVQMEKVSVIIPTYNRFKYVLECINAVKKQTYTNLEIIVINDGSSQQEYYNHDWEKEGVIMIHLKKNTNKLFGYPCVGYVINKGIEIFTGDYFATCDDDDVWFPNKLELQINAMKKSGCKMCATDGLVGKGRYNPHLKYPKYNAEANFKELQKIFQSRGSMLLNNGFPDIWDYNLLKIHNCIVACSVIIHKDIINKIGKKLEIKMGGAKNVQGEGAINSTIIHTDYDYWLRAIRHTNCVYIKDVCFYYDDAHGDGQLYK